jgi:hypothetical protein
MGCEPVAGILPDILTDSQVTLSGSLESRYGTQ